MSPIKYIITLRAKYTTKRLIRILYTNYNLSQVVMRTSLSKAEFASALGMKPDAVFVRMMFNIVDKDSDGRISFQVCKRIFVHIRIDIFLNNAVVEI